jgi:hypothetical protein
MWSADWIIGNYRVAGVAVQKIDDYIHSVEELARTGC